MVSFLQRLLFQWLASLLAEKGPLTYREVYRLEKADWEMEGCFGSMAGVEGTSDVRRTDSDMVRDALAAEPVHVNV